MRYLMMTMRDETEATPDEAMFAEMGKFVAELSASGILVASGGLDPAGTELTYQDGEITVTDGPYAEAKETVGGFALVDVRDKDELNEVARRFFAITGNGVSRIHQVYS